MSSVALNDENCGVFPGRKNSSSEYSDDIFALDQPTGRPSILRQSQAENLPNKTVAKGVKVCFQTPRRDPVTKRIVSPTKSLKLTCLDECTKAMESLQLQSTEALPQDGVELVDGLTSEVSSYSDDNMPIQSRGGYQLDFDNLDAINPFGGSSKMVLSPPRPAVQDLPIGRNEPQASDSFTPENMLEEPAKTETTLDDTLPFSRSVENSLADMSTDIPSTDSSVVTVAKNPAAEASFSIIADEEPSAATRLSLDRDEANIPSVEDAPLPARGAYSFDLDNFDSINPFQTGGSGILNSLESQESSSTIADKEPSAATCLSLDQEEASANIPSLEDAPLPAKGAYSFDLDNLDSINPFQTGGSGILNSLESQESSSTIADKEPSAATCLSLDQEEASANIPSLEDAPLPAKGAYSFDLDNLDSINPFQTGGPGILNSLESQESSSTIADKEPSAATCLSLDQEEASANIPSLEDAPLPAKGAYSFDLDNLDSIDPFQTGGSKIQNSPAPGRKLSDKPVKGSAIKAMESADIVNVPEAFEEAPVLPEIKPVAAVAPTLNDATKPPDAPSTPQPIAAPPKEGPVKLEFNFDDGGEVRRKPPPKKFGKRPPGLKSTEKKAVPVEKACPPSKESAATPPPDNVDEGPALKGSYTFDMDKFDDPNINPFGTGAKMNNSPVCRVKSNPARNNTPALAKEAAAPVPAKAAAAPVPAKAAAAPVPAKAAAAPVPAKAAAAPVPAKAAAAPVPAKEAAAPVPAKEAAAPVPAKEAAAPEQMSKPAEHEATCSGDSVSKTNGPNPAALKQNKMSEDQEVKAVTSHALASQPELEQPVRSTPEPSELGQLEQICPSELDEEFVPGAMFMSNDFDGRQIDYLEQFGSTNFKESVLRKQSLYLKFDPLLKESPSKAGGLSAQNHHPRPSIAPLASRWEAQQTGAKQATHKRNDLKLLDDVPLLAVNPLVQNPQMLQNLVQPENAEGAIIEVLKYSQKDMDAAIAKVQAKAKEKDEQWSTKYNQISEENQEMRKIISEYENTFEQMMVEQRKDKELAQVALNQVLQEKEQVSQDLNSMERSFSDLFKRLEKYKAAIEGYKKNEETLKRCAQDYLAMVKQGELRYQNLKAHAEEKITKANAEIAEVRSKIKAESAAMQAQLRREQMKVHSLEKSLDQKVKESEELTKLCDELIANAQKF